MKTPYRKLTIIITTITRPWKYWRVLWEGGDNNPSYRRIAQLVFLILIVYLIMKQLTLTSWGFYTLCVLLVAFLLLAKLITSQQILEGINSVNKFNTVSKTASTTKTEIEIKEELKPE